MKQITVSVVIILSIFFQSCNNNEVKEPSQNDIIGRWKSSGGAEFVFNADRTFTGNHIPAEFGFFPVDSFKNVKFNGSGRWTLRKGNTNWEVYVDFSKVSINKNGCAFPLLIAGEKGVLENKPPWYLFVWKGEEGGERYKFSKE